jgi:hypothetical protein
MRLDNSGCASAEQTAKQDFSLFPVECNERPWSSQRANHAGIEVQYVYMQQLRRLGRLYTNSNNFQQATCSISLKYQQYPLT